MFPLILTVLSCLNWDSDSRGYFEPGGLGPEVNIRRSWGFGFDSVVLHCNFRALAFFGAYWVSEEGS